MQRLPLISSSRLQILELAAIVIGPPLLILISSQSLRFFALFLLASYCLWRLIKGGAKQTYLRWNWEGCRLALPGILLRAVIAWIVVLSLVQWFYPTRLVCIPNPCTGTHSRNNSRIRDPIRFASGGRVPRLCSLEARSVRAVLLAVGINLGCGFWLGPHTLRFLAVGAALFRRRVGTLSARTTELDLSLPCGWSIACSGQRSSRLGLIQCSIAELSSTKPYQPVVGLWLCYRVDLYQELSFESTSYGSAGTGKLFDSDELVGELCDHSTL